jgi:hypothetical protein
MKTKVKVFKNGQEVGWYKDITPGANAVIATCKNLGYDITQYHFTEYDNTENIVWRGEKSMVDDLQYV